MPMVENDGARIHWTAVGSGTPVLLIMGHLFSSRMWYPLIPELAAHHRVISFDNRGTGDSDTTGGVSIAQLAADALAVLDAAGEAKAHVYGVSMGGGIAAELAMAHPDRVLSLTLGCTMLKTEPSNRPLLARLLYRLPHGFVRKALLKRSTPAGYGSAAPLDAVARDLEVLAGERFTMHGIRQQNIAIARYATTRERAQHTLTMPVLVLHGDEDKAVDVKYGREIHDILPHSQIEIFAGAGHNYLVAAGERATRAFIDFIDQ
jgi:3-oxoadipate enol-lactonase